MNCLSATGQTISSPFLIGFDLGLTDATELNQLILTPVNNNLDGDLSLQSESKNVSIRAYTGVELFSKVFIELSYSRLNIYQSTRSTLSQSRIPYFLGAQDSIQGYELRIAKKFPLSDSSQSIQLGLGLSELVLDPTITINNNPTLDNDQQRRSWGKIYFVGYEKKLNHSLALRATIAKQLQNAFGQNWPLSTWSVGLCNYF
jgi:hypothetical protein